MVGLPLFMRPLSARDPDESHRASTPLELFFDLVAVIALASVASGFHQALTEQQALSGLLYFLMAFLAVWWPWNMFTWFASAFDNDDPCYRIMVMIMMVGLMVIAADIPQFFGEQELQRIFLGYLIMRAALMVLWVRVGLNNPKYRKTAIRYLMGQVLLQAFWVLVIFGLKDHTTLFYVLFFLGFGGELFVPWFAENAGVTTWHRDHIVERFGLLNIIVLGEILLGSSELLEGAFEHDLDRHLLYLSGCGIVTAFSMWWLYFAEETKLHHERIHRNFLWNYGHIFVFVGGIATGAALGASTEIHDQIVETGLHKRSDPVRWAVGLSMATYVFGVWFVRDRFVCSKGQVWVLLVIAILLALSPLLTIGPFLPPALLVLGVLIRQMGRKTADPKG